MIRLHNSKFFIWLLFLFSFAGIKPGNMIIVSTDKQGVALKFNGAYIKCTLCGDHATRVGIDVDTHEMFIGCDLHPEGDNTPEANTIEKRVSLLRKVAQDINK